MKGWLIYSQKEVARNQAYIEFYIEEGKKRQVEIELLLEEEISFSVSEEGKKVLYCGLQVEAPGFAICRTRNYLLSRELELHGITVYNNSFISMVANNKLLSCEYVAELGIPIMPTVAGAGMGTDKDVKYPCIMKSLSGCGGTEVFYVENELQYKAAWARMEGRQFLLQEPASDLGKDVRVYVIGNTIVKAMLRTSESDFRSNYCLGGTAEEYFLSKREREMVEKIIERFDFGFVGIDFIFHHGEMIFNEIEDVVGSRMLYDKTDVNPVALYLEHILSEVAERTGNQAGRTKNQAERTRNQAERTGNPGRKN